MIRFAKVKPDAVIPSKELENAGYDLYACFNEDFILIPSLTTKLIPTGIASYLGTEYYLQIQERGSTGSKGIKYGAGVIDGTYTGEIFIAITNCNENPLVISKLSSEELFDKYANEIMPWMDCVNIDYFNNNVIVYPYSKAIAQAIIHKVHNMPVKEISYEELKSLPSQRGAGKLGSSGK